MRKSIDLKSIIVSLVISIAGICLGIYKGNMLIAGYLICVGAGILLLPIFKQKEDDKRRKEEILREYPEMVSKMAVLVGTGMTVRRALVKVVERYDEQKGKNLLYEEIIIVIKEQQSGMSESMSYEHMARRCDIPEIWKFTHLLSLNLKTGQSNLAEKLHEIALDAHNAQRRNVRKRGEEAGTKLVFPMMIYLIIVFVIILVPAFSSLSFS